MRIPWSPLLVVACLLLAGCSGGSGRSSEHAQTAMQAPTAPAADYTVTIVVTQETASGTPVRTQVQGTPLRSDGTLGTTESRNTDAEGAARFRFAEPTTLLVRAAGPDGWTDEGARVHIGTSVAAEGLLVSERDVFLPLFRTELAFVGEKVVSTAVAQPGADLAVDPAVALHRLALPEGLQEAYLSRLSGASVAASWTDSESGRAINASVGLAWGDTVWVEGDAAPVTQLGPRTATWRGDLPSTGRPVDLEAAELQTALLTRTAIVGDVLFAIETTLEFGGRVPAELPVDDCHLLQASRGPC